MNWGIKIVIALALFMALIVSFGVYMVRSNTDTLESGDYYEQGLQYDEVYHREQNLLRDKATPVLSTASDTLTIRFARAGNRGKLRMLRPSDQAQDTVFLIDISGERYRLPTHALSSGLWQVQLEWENEGVPYQFEQRLFLNE